MIEWEAIYCVGIGEENAILKKAMGIFATPYMCKVLRVSKSGYYIWFKRPTSMRKQAKAKLTAKIKYIHIQSRGIYGSSKIT